MPQTIADLLTKLPENQMRIAVVLICIIFATGGSGYNVLNAKLDDIKERSDEKLELLKDQSNRKDTEIEKQTAEQRIMLQAMSQKIDEIHSFYLQRGLGGNQGI
jgi:hypothetical protein